MGTNTITLFTPSPDDKKRALSHIYYEMRQLIDVYQLLTMNPHRNVAVSQIAASGTSGRTGAQPVIDAPEPRDNAMLESLLLHVRVLSDFFEHTDRSVMKGAEQDDVLCSDFQFGDAPLNFPAKIGASLNKLLAHLTYSRPPVATPATWQIRDIVKSVADRCRDFIGHLETNGQIAAAETEKWRRLKADLAI